jgi:murein L,D-transpeptidase YcbB/YkuD
VAEHATSHGRTIPNSTVQRMARAGSLSPKETTSGVNRMMGPKVYEALTGKKPPKQAGGFGSIARMITQAMYAMRLTKRGDRSLDVFIVQIQLNQLGASPTLATDMIFGPKTQRAVKEFQTANNLDPDGIVGIKTRTALNQQLNAQATIAAIREVLGGLDELRKRLGLPSLNPSPPGGQHA